MFGWMSFISENKDESTIKKIKSIMDCTGYQISVLQQRKESVTKELAAVNGN